MAVEINISQEDIQYAKTLITEYLENNIEGADFSDGTALQDLVVKSTAYTFAFLRSELTKVGTLRSLARLNDLDEDDEVNEAVDDIISNFFINRGGGEKSVVGVTLVLSQRVDIYIGEDDSFDRDGTHIFVPGQVYNIAKENLIEKVTTDGVVTYEYDLTLQAESIGSEYDVPAGNFVSWTNFNPYVIRVYNDQKASGGAPLETNQEYIDRSKDAITVRNLINPKSIRTVLLEVFKDQGLKDVTTIGYGDPEMLRDKINTNVTWITIDTVHIGNHQDIYLNLPLIEEQVYSGITGNMQYLGEPDRDGVVQLPSSPVYKIHDVRDSITEESLLYHLYVRDSNLFYSDLQEAFVILDSAENGRAIDIIYDTVNGFDVIHNYLRDPEERITLANTLAKAVIPIYISVNIDYTQISGQPDLDEEAAVETVVNYINSLSNSSELNIDNLVKEVHSSYSQYIIIRTPLSIKGEVIYPDGTSQVFYSDNILTVPEYKSLGVTNRICGFFTSNSYVSFTRL